MKTGCKTWMIFLLLFLWMPSLEAAVRVVSSPIEQGETIMAGEQRLEKARARIERNRGRYEKRMNRLERRMKKRGLSGEEQSQDIWNDNKFRLGLLLLLVAIGLGIIGAIISLAGLFSFMAGLFALAGIILLIWSLVENYG